MRGNRPTKVRFCGIECRAASDKRNELRDCWVCGVSFHVPKSFVFRGEPQRYCSRKCSSAARPMKISMKTWITEAGYVELRLPGHPHARNGRVLEHVVVAEDKLGRALRPDEHVHHRNGNKRDNRPENLQVLTASEHSKLHIAERKLNPPSERWRKNFAHLPDDPTPAS